MLYYSTPVSQPLDISLFATSRTCLRSTVRLVEVREDEVFVGVLNNPVVRSLLDMHQPIENSSNTLAYRPK